MIASGTGAVIYHGRSYQEFGRIQYTRPAANLLLYVSVHTRAFYGSVFLHTKIGMSGVTDLRSSGDAIGIRDSLIQDDVHGRICVDWNSCTKLMILPENPFPNNNACNMDVRLRSFFAIVLSACAIYTNDGHETIVYVHESISSAAREWSARSGVDG